MHVLSPSSDSDSGAPADGKFRAFPAFIMGTVLAVALGTATVAVAGVEVQLATKDYRAAQEGAEPEDQASSMRMQDGNLWMDLGLGKEGERSSIYRAAEDSLLLIDHGRKTYSVMDERAIELITDEMQLAMMNLDQRMGRLPPEQRKLLQDALKGDTPSRLPTKIKSTAEVATVAGFSSRKFNVFQGEQKIREVWVVEWSRLPGGDEVLRSLEGADALYKRLKATYDSVASATLGGVRLFDLGESPFADLQAMKGFPVRTRNYQDGTLISETRVVALQEKELESAAFDPPAGYEKKVMRGE